MQYCFSSRLSVSILALCCGCVFATSTIAAELPAPPEKAEHETLPLKPAALIHIGKFAITNSMLVTWVVAAGIIVFAQLAMRKIERIPSGAQNFWEWLVEGLYNFLENIIGRDLVRKTFWFFATIFIFILFVNWFGLIPGVCTIGWREVVSILFRPVSLSFRLFGNIYAGESTLEVMSSMVPFLSWLIPIPFYFLELLVGVVQALVFTLLTAVFTLLIAQHGPET